MGTAEYISSERRQSGKTGCLRTREQVPKVNAIETTVAATCVAGVIRAAGQSGSKAAKMVGVTTNRKNSINSERN